MLGAPVSAISFRCWLLLTNCRFQILITGGSSGLVETITDAVSIHSIKKSLYARRLNEGRLDQVTLLDHFINASSFLFMSAMSMFPVTYASFYSHMEIHLYRNSLVRNRILCDHWPVH